MSKLENTFFAVIICLLAFSLFMVLLLSVISSDISNSEAAYRKLQLNIEEMNDCKALCQVAGAKTYSYEFGSATDCTCTWDVEQ